MSYRNKQGLFVALFLYAFLALYWIMLLAGWHETIWWFDDLLHFLGGFWVAALFGYLINRWGLTSIDNKFWLKLLLGLGFVALVGILWEFHEFIADWFLQKPLMQEGIGDTMSDLFFDLLGGSVFIVFYHYAVKFCFKSNEDKREV